METKTLPLLKVGVRLIKECRRETIWLILWILMMTAAAVLRVQYTRLIGQAGDAVLAGEVNFFTDRIGILIAVALGSIVASMMISYLSGKYKTLTAARLSQKTMQSLNGAQYPWLQHQKSGDLLQRANSETTLAADLISGWLPDTINAFLQILLAAYFIISVDWRLALTYFGMFPVALIVQAWVSKPIEKTRLVAQEAMTLQQWRECFAWVPQSSPLFDGTIADNIGLGREGASRAEIEAAAKAAYAHDFITKLPEGYDTPVGEGATMISGEQRQRIAIARAILRDAPILLLDEATSSLDSQSEQEVQAALEHLMKGRATVVVAHRLSTIEKADAIAVLDQGYVVEEGRHAALLKANSKYAAMVKAGSLT